MISLIISTDYANTSIALYKEKACIAQIQEENKHASKFLLAHIDTLCAQYEVNSSDIEYIAINQGPGPFTTLRVTLATINGIAFSSGIPLIGVDGLKALIDEHTDIKWPLTIALLNAFNDDAYYAIQAPHHDPRIGYKKISALLTELKDEYPGVPLRLIGGGVNTFKDQIQVILGGQSIIPDNLPLAPSMDQIAALALRQYNQRQTSSKLLPLYLKIMDYKKSITLA